MIVANILERAAATPDRPAVIHNDHTIGYGAFGAAIRRARAFFAAEGLGGEGVAVLRVQGLIDLWVLSLALRSLGLTTVPVPAARFLMQLDLPNVRVVVGGPTQTDLAPICAARGWPLLLVPPLQRESPEVLSSSPGREGGHIMHTSGTTGAPKKVLMDPAFEAGFLRDRARVFGIDENSVVNSLNLGPWSGGGYKTAVCAWQLGACAMIKEGRDPAEGLSDPRVTLTHIIPTTLAAALASPALKRNPGMMISVAAGSISEAQAEATRSRITPRLYADIGSTEALTFTLTPLQSSEDRRWHRLVEGRGVQVVDENDRPAPVGEVGRLRVPTQGGPSAYLHDDETTRAFFKGGYFYTGDLALIREDGRMALQGRATDVINLRGAKLAPQPLEDALRDRLGVAGVCLFSMQDDDAEEVLHVVVEGDAAADLAAVSAALRGAMRDPPTIRAHWVPALPRNPMGKLERAKVKALLVDL